MAPIIEVKNLTKIFKSKIKTSGFGASVKSVFSPQYKTVNAVDNINFSIDKGEILAFIGPNGAGKSTTIKLITGILFPDDGHILVNGLNPHKKRKALSYKIGTVFGQKSQLWFHLPPIDSFNLLGDIYNLDKKQIQKKVDFLTDVFELKEFLEQPVRKLSLGQRIRCEIAASLIHEPEILFLDEPSIGLDVVVKMKIRDLIKRINEENKVTVFLTSHDAGDIEKICKRVIIINNGRVVWDDSVKTLKYSFLNKRIIDLKLDSPIELSMNGVEVLKSRDYSLKIEIDLDKITVEKVITTILKSTGLQDINISTTPMEEVISHIYEGRL